MITVVSPTFSRQLYLFIFLLISINIIELSLLDVNNHPSFFFFLLDSIFHMHLYHFYTYFYLYNYDENKLEEIYNYKSDGIYYDKRFCCSGTNSLLRYWPRERYQLTEKKNQWLYNKIYH